ncbi:hypothetical protein JQ557_07800 [Bradyrhizobium sp. U87765 SZCCT0131]|uniref:hypothetical protein n=1 Tax=unclassified Bradyrhizobium TaxID=2631580 RepID=UPI001BA57E46|nr:MULTISPECIES: hypothetical protein [unclassified Bradyrhizobium]MBR1217888.1 hypothetical protein [Bradyrhizobium sp. U87765 SZCCT0131]MBR1261166.1 hypothetical protein [Bradyrhizobium sp. U87765 SZCCT0134]MBR1303386.1 hypothetical protein [Bradyrhizobium sp. U87765 SZCCT0110]MBR1318992.1 hypothetical protein [Bradyrhizobium sp. U87765 SZCCT0109]MBR1347317.1 hypothetical protein [Bradyrhizobium sp. U87765 SZCCT0048]
MRELFKVLPLGLLLPVFLAAASVKPGDAQANISAWAGRVGIHDLPTWATNPMAVTVAFYAATGGAAIYSGAVWIVPAMRRRSGPELTRVLVIFALIATLLGAIGYAASLTSRKRDVPKVTTPSNQLVSTFGKTILRCVKPKTADARDPKDVIAETAENMRAIGEKFGLSMMLTTIQNGIRIEMLPATREGKIRMGGSEKWLLEASRSDAELLVYSHMQMPSVLGMLADLMPIDPQSKTIVQERETIEHILGVALGGCRIM